MNPQSLDTSGLDQEALAGKNGSAAGDRNQIPEEEVNYKPVPPPKTVTVSVLYRVRGRGHPLPYLFGREGRRMSMEAFWVPITNSGLRQGDYLPICLMPVFGYDIGEAGQHEVLAGEYELLASNRWESLASRLAGYL